ncbi:MAG: glycoside hydrolase family 125 protein [Lachnospiraceae bacterium]|nr:glycoside hydrolase family 125 protein [Lachnospiraceae bacterium]
MRDNKLSASSDRHIPDRDVLLAALGEAADSVCRRIDTGDAAFDGKLRSMYKKCFMDTAERTLLLPGMESSDHAGNTHTVSDEVFIITGDINAMWLRDSSAQVCHYMPFAGKYPEIAELIASLIRRQRICIMRDPYANAYLEWPGAVSAWKKDRCGMVPGDWERKYETDSLSYHILLVKNYIKYTGDTSILDEQELNVLDRIISLWELETDHENRSQYTFERTRINGMYAGLARNGRGTPLTRTGMTWSGFRPSDDPCEYGYNIPENLFAASVLRFIEELPGPTGSRAAAAPQGRLSSLASRAGALRRSIADGVLEHGTINHPELGNIYVYETDGLGSHILMDDPNVPSLLALPYLGICSPEDELYLNTRRFILSARNPWYYSGSAASGTGSPHTPEGYIWPIGLIIQGFTSSDPAERMSLLRTLVNTDASTLSMHESFDVNDPARYTRSWFAWADSLFAEYVAELFP